VRILSKEKSSSSASAISEAEKEIAADKDKNEINISAAASESAGEKSVKEEKATQPAESGESKGVVAWLTDFLGL